MGCVVGICDTLGCRLGNVVGKSEGDCDPLGLVDAVTEGLFDGTSLGLRLGWMLGKELGDVEGDRVPVCTINMI